MKRIGYIDGINGIGALMVFLTHYRMMGLFYPNTFFFDNPFFRLIMSGNLAVHIFLLVSGFCVVLSVVDKIQYDMKGLQTIVLKRYFRLALPIAFILLLEGVLYIWGAFPPHNWVLQFGVRESVVDAYQDLSLLKLLAAILLSPLGINCGWLSPLWMLKYIFLGTFLIIIIRIGTSGLSFKLKLFWNLFFIIIFGFISEYYISVLMGNFLYEISFLNKSCNSRIQKSIKEVIAFLLLVVGIVLFVYIDKIINFFIAFLLVSSVFISDVMQRFLSRNVFLWLGTISFSLYLIHWPLICSYSLWGGHNLFCFSNPYINAICLFSTTVLLLFVLSSLYTKYIEKQVCSYLLNFLQKRIM